MFNFVKKTSILKKNIKKWNISTFGNIFKQLKEVEEELATIQTITCNNPNAMLGCKEQRLLLKQRRLIVFHKNYRRQRSKNNHLKSMDFNSGYFHKIASGEEVKDH